MTTAPNMNDAAAVIDLFHGAADALHGKPRDGSVVRLPEKGSLIATGDLHDNPINLGKILSFAKLEQNQDRHIVFHEIIHSERLVNGVDLSHRMLARIAGLVLEYPGRVHPVLANHELAQMLNQGVSKGAGDNVQLFNDGLEFVFGDDWVEVADAANAFIRAFPLAAIADGGVLCAHSLPSPRAMEKFDLDVINRDLTDADYESPDGAAYLMTWGRGLNAAHGERMAEAWGVELFVLGHQYVETGLETIGEHIVILNSDHEDGRILQIDLTDPPNAIEAPMMAIPLRSL